MACCLFCKQHNMIVFLMHALSKVLCLLCIWENLSSINYRIAGNFQGRKVSLINRKHGENFRGILKLH